MGTSRQPLLRSNSLALEVFQHTSQESRSDQSTRHVFSDVWARFRPVDMTGGRLSWFSGFAAVYAMQVLTASGADQPFRRSNERLAYRPGTALMGVVVSNDFGIWG
jgi:hypothetical protein